VLPLQVASKLASSRSKAHNLAYLSDHLHGPSYTVQPGCRVMFADLTRGCMCSAAFR
jgi:hypothetical protein